MCDLDILSKWKKETKLYLWSVYSTFFFVFSNSFLVYTPPLSLSLVTFHLPPPPLLLFVHLYFFPSSPDITDFQIEEKEFISFLAYHTAIPYPFLVWLNPDLWLWLLGDYCFLSLSSPLLLLLDIVGYLVVCIIFSFFIPLLYTAFAKRENCESRSCGFYHISDMYNVTGTYLYEMSVCILWRTGEKKESSKMR